MIQEPKQALYDGFDRLRNNRVAILCVILAIALLAVPAAAQVHETFTDDFEDQNTNGWEQNAEGLPNISTDSVEGQYALYTTSPESGGRATWADGPKLDLSEQFTIQATFKQNPIDDTTATPPTRFGIQTDSGDSALVIFDTAADKTYLAVDANPAEPTDSSEYIAGTFDNTYVNIELVSDGSGSLELYLWEYGTQKPSEPNLTKQFTGASGKLSIDVGVQGPGGGSQREAWLDSTTIEGVDTSPEDPTLRLDTGNYLGFGETQDYTVFDIVGEREIRTDVTENATVTSGNTSVITVDQSTNELTATADENVSTRVNITAEYDGRTDIHQVTVASPTIENLEVLPFMWRISAMFLDRGFQMILVGVLLSVAAARVGGVFAGLGIYQMSLTAGWLIGWVPIGLAMVGLFSTLFIGLNIAANIDYSVRR